jgi:hypothetical protein
MPVARFYHTQPLLPSPSGRPRRQPPPPAVAPARPALALPARAPGEGPYHVCLPRPRGGPTAHAQRGPSRVQQATFRPRGALLHIVSAPVVRFWGPAVPSGRGLGPLGVLPDARARLRVAAARGRACRRRPTQQGANGAFASSRHGISDRVLWRPSSRPQRQVGRARGRRPRGDCRRTFEALLFGPTPRLDGAGPPCVGLLRFRVAAGPPPPCREAAEPQAHLLGQVGCPCVARS